MRSRLHWLKVRDSPMKEFFASMRSRKEAERSKEIYNEMETWQLRRIKYRRDEPAF